MNDLVRASELLTAFRSGSLKKAVSKIEARLVGVSKTDVCPQLGALGVSMELMLAALLIKKHSNQISEIIHTIGILLVLPSILEVDEKVESLSLAAGNTGKGFDLETNIRIAEFTFIQWQGGSESIRQNKVFKDFYFLAEHETSKRRELYVAGLDYPTRFLNSGRGIEQIAKNNRKLGESALHLPPEVKTVRDYYVPRQNLVSIRDLCDYIPALRS
jgi:hypothetical protein